MQDSLASWARERLNRVDLHMNVHGEEMDQLRTSGVSESRVQSLYPFEISDYYGGLNWLLPASAGHSTEGLHTAFGFSNIWYGVAAYLPMPSQKLAGDVADQRLGSHEPIANLTQRKLVFHNILQVPVVLRSLAVGEQLTLDYSNADRQTLDASFELFRNVVEEFIDYLDQKATRVSQ